MSSVKFLFLTAICVYLSGCAVLNPFVDRRRNAGVSDPALVYSGESKADAPAICYNGLLTEYSDLQKMADEECKKNGTGSKAVFVKETNFTCKLLLPSHIYFKCEK